MGIQNMLRYINDGDVKVGRRDFLKVAGIALSASALGCESTAGPGKQSILWIRDVLAYAESLRREDGGYAWPDQDRSHLTPTFAAIGCYHLLERTPPEKKSLVEYVLTHHPFRIKKLERDLKVFEYQQIQSLLRLGEDAGSFREQVRSWKKPSVYPKQYERDGVPILRFELMALICRRLLGLGMDDISRELIEYVDSRRRENGSFNNTPAGDGSDGHVMNTWWGLQGLAILDRAEVKRKETVAWVQDCQLSNGGFTYQPKPSFGGVDDITYTWAAARILEFYGAKPARYKACINYVQSLWNEDGGFGQRPGWVSNPMATYYALDTMRALGGFEPLSNSPRPRIKKPQRRRIPKDLKVFNIQIEAHGKGSPADAVELARGLRIDLWGAKNAASGWIEAAQAIADERKVPVTFFVANEEYGTFVKVDGMGTYSHTSDVIAPPNVDFGPSLAGQQALSWEEFRRRRLAPLEKAGGRLIWQFNENEELTRMYLDDSVQRGGYAAISTFHFGNPDFANSEPFLKFYQQQIPFVALQDAHGNEPWWWSDQVTGFRTLFLAKEPTWAGWLKALEEKRVVAVRHDSVSGNETWMHGGVPEAVDFVREREQQWRWWDNPRIKRPLVSIVAVRPDDKFEKARPEQGVTVRVRCQRDNTLRGLPKAPRVELVKLIIDGREVEPKLVAPKAQWGAYQDYYHFYHIKQPTPGKHTATAIVRKLDTGTTTQHTIEFII